MASLWNNGLYVIRVENAYQYKVGDVFYLDDVFPPIGIIVDTDKVHTVTVCLNTSVAESRFRFMVEDAGLSIVDKKDVAEVDKEKKDKSNQIVTRWELIDL